jgi:hypothetical protein
MVRGDEGIDPSDAVALSQARARYIQRNPAAKRFDEVIFVPETLEKLTEMSPVYASLFDKPLVAISNQDALTGSGFVSGDKSALVLQVHDEAETLRNVPTVALLLRLSSGEILLPGLKKTAEEGVFVLKPLLLILNEIYRAMKTEQVSVGASA